MKRCARRFAYREGSCCAELWEWPAAGAIICLWMGCAVFGLVGLVQEAKIMTIITFAITAAAAAFYRRIWLPVMIEVKQAEKARSLHEAAAARMYHAQMARVYEETARIESLLQPYMDRLFLCEADEVQVHDLEWSPLAAQVAQANGLELDKDMRMRMSRETADAYKAYAVVIADAHEKKRSTPLLSDSSCSAAVASA